jgi:hypothetical protein
MTKSYWFRDGVFRIALTSTVNWRGRELLYNFVFIRVDSWLKKNCSARFRV